MVDKKLDRITKLYKVTIEQELKNPITQFVHVVDISQRIPPITVVYLHDKIYVVKYLNNDFFELENDDDLYYVVSSILEGNYQVQTSIFRKRKSIRIPKVKTKYICPKRVYSDKSFMEDYKTLPVIFSTK